MGSELKPILIGEIGRYAIAFLSVTTTEYSLESYGRIGPTPSFAIMLEFYSFVETEASMAIEERVCEECGKRFAVSPNKPGRVNVCPQCSSPAVGPYIPERKPRKRRKQTPNEEVRESERRVHRLQKLKELITPKGK